MYIPTKSWSSANAYYLSINHLCKHTLRKLRVNHPIHEIRYEDLITEPETVLKGIAGAFDIDLSTAIQKVRNDEYLQVGDLFAGNTMRMKEQIKLRRGAPETDWNLRNRMTRIINMTSLLMISSKWDRTALQSTQKRVKL